MWWRRFRKVRERFCTVSLTTRIQCRLRRAMRCSITSSGKIFRACRAGGTGTCATALEPLKRFSVVGDMRGMGLLWAIEFVRDAKTREPFPARCAHRAAIQEDALEAGVMTYPMQGCVDGTRGDHILIAPPFTITSQHDSNARRGPGTRHRRSGKISSRRHWRVFCAALEAVGVMRLMVAGSCVHSAADVASGSSARSCQNIRIFAPRGGAGNHHGKFISRIHFDC